MKKDTIYDLVVIGNGIAAQIFLWNLFEDIKCQDFSVAQISDEKLAPACTLRSSATVSLNGISEDVSPLGNDMRAAYYLFEKFVEEHHPDGVIKVDRHVISTNENDENKLIRRYKKVEQINSPFFNMSHRGVIYPSYLINNDFYHSWLQRHSSKSVDSFNLFIKNIKKNDEGFFECESSCQQVVIAKKVLLATGAYAKIFNGFFYDLTGIDKESKNEIKAGTYLEKEIVLPFNSFYLSIDSYNILYKSNILQIGSTSVLGAFSSAPLVECNEILKHCQKYVSFDLGEISEYQKITGLRHKAPKRMIECSESLVTPGLFHFNGLYKNGFSMSFLGARKIINLL